MHLSILSNFVFVRTIVQALCTVCIIFFIFLITEANARAQVKQGLIGTNNFRSFINTVRNYTQKPGSAQLQAHSQRAIEVRVPKRGIQEGKEKGEERIRCRRRG